jgi:hypothetical protein
MIRFAALGAYFRLLIVVGTHAEAQTVTTGESLFSVFKPYLVELASVLVAAVVAWLFKLIRERLDLCAIIPADLDRIKTGLLIRGQITYHMPHGLWSIWQELLLFAFGQCLLKIGETRAWIPRSASGHLSHVGPVGARRRGHSWCQIWSETASMTQQATATAARATR